MTRFPTIKAKEFIRAIKRLGFVEVGGKGSHVIFKNTHRRTRIVVAVHGGRDIPRPTLKKMLSEGGLSPEEFFGELGFKNSA